MIVGGTYQGQKFQLELNDGGQLTGSGPGKAGLLDALIADLGSWAPVPTGDDRRVDERDPAGVLAWLRRADDVQISGVADAPLLVGSVPDGAVA